MSVSIQPMTEDDVELVHASGIEVEAFQTTDAEAEESPFWPKERLREWVRSGDDVLLVAEDDGTIVGYFLSHLHEITGAAYIENLYVDEKYRRQGIGKRLLTEGVNRIVANGGRYISALTKPDNDAMRALLREADFNEGDTFVWMDRVCK
jgi:ribosomal protein S18 acetylase RimI-like enzyme